MTAQTLSQDPRGGLDLEIRRWAARLRVAIVHDWLLGMRGGERVLESLLRLFPLAEIYTLFYDPEGVSETINRHAIFPSPLNGLPGVRRYYRSLLPIMPSTVERLRIRGDAELVISSSHCVAHGVRPPAGARHLTYCHSPMRYLYGQSAAYAEGGAGLGVKLLGAIAPRLRAWDRAAAIRCGTYWANSRTVARRIDEIYGLKARVIHPPARTEFFTPPKVEEMPGAGAQFLIVSALTPYKRVDLAIQAANALRAPLIIVGRGPSEGALRRIAGPTVRFEGWVDDGRLLELYRSCRALIFPGEEDFGIAPVEAMACGRPVLALRAGGLTETMIEGMTGEFFDAPSVEALTEAWRRFEPESYDAAAIRRRAEMFGEERFLSDFARELREFMNS